MFLQIFASKKDKKLYWWRKEVFTRWGEVWNVPISELSGSKPPRKFEQHLERDPSFHNCINIFVKDLPLEIEIQDFEIVKMFDHRGRKRLNPIIIISFTNKKTFLFKKGIYITEEGQNISLSEVDDSQTLFPSKSILEQNSQIWILV